MFCFVFLGLITHFPNESLDKIQCELDERIKWGSSQEFLSHVQRPIYFRYPIPTLIRVLGHNRLSLPPPKYLSWSLLTDYGHNQFQFWVVIDSISTPEISVVVVIDRLRLQLWVVIDFISLTLEISVVVVINRFRPQLIPILGCYRSISTPILSVEVLMVGYDPDRFQFWVIIDSQYLQNTGCGRYRSFTTQIDSNSGS